MSGVGTPVGERLADRYVIERQLGAGGMATVSQGTGLKLVVIPNWRTDLRRHTASLQ